MEDIKIPSRQDIWNQCSQKIKSYVQETEKIRINLELLKKEVRKIDPALLEEPRYNSDDWRLVQLVKTICCAVRGWFYGAGTDKKKEAIQTFQRTLKSHEEVESKITTTFNQVFGLEEGIESAAIVGERFKTFARFSEGEDLALKTDDFLDCEELKETFLADITDRSLYDCDEIEASDSETDYFSFSESESESESESLSLSSESPSSLSADSESVLKAAPLTLTTLLCS